MVEKISTRESVGQFLADAGEEFCLSDAILSNSSANQYDVDLGDCFNGFGCMDMAACNYD